MKKAMQGVVVALLVPVLLACSHSSFDPPERNGPIGLVDTGSGRQAWLATIQEEERSRHVGGGSRRVGRWVTEHLYHLRVQAHDPATAQRLWLKELKVLRDRDGGAGAQVRILGQQEGVVWVWVHDQVLGLSARDGSQVADRATLERANPDLKGLVPGELKFHTWVGALVVTLADARRVRIAVPGFRAVPYQVADERQFSHAVSLGTTWNGGHDTREFGVRHGRFGDDWIGLLSEKEARDAADDGRGDHYADSGEIDDEGDMARRTFWRASSGYNDEFLRWGGAKGGERGFCEDQVSTVENREEMELLMRSNDIEEFSRRRGADPQARRARISACVDGFDPEKYRRINGIERVAGAGEFLQGRMLKAEAIPGAPQWIQRGVLMKPAVRPPLRLQGPDGVLVLHRTRMDAHGRLALSRVDATFARTRWTAVLPFDAMTNRWSAGRHLLLYGTWSEVRAGVTTPHEALLALDLGNGHWRAWDVGMDKAVPPPP